MTHTPPDPLPEVLDAREAAALLKVSADTLRADAKAGLIPHARVGNRFRFSRTALLEWLANPPIGRPPPPPGPKVKRTVPVVDNAVREELRARFLRVQASNRSRSPVIREK